MLHPVGDREPGFRFLGGRPCLDLTATAGEPGRRAEQLATPRDLASWLVEAGLADQPPATSRRDLAHARTLRDAVHQTIRRQMAGQPPGPGHLAIINDWACQPPPRRWLEADNGQLRARNDAPTAAAPLAGLARDAVDLLSGPLAHRIRACRADDCTLLFLDASRAGKRRWCSMATCGARAKMAAYRARRPSTARERDGTRSGEL